MKKILTAFVILSATIFYGINSNAVFLKNIFFKIDTSILSSYDQPLEKDQFEFIVNEKNANKKMTCIQINGVLYCHES